MIMRSLSRPSIGRSGDGLERAGATRAVFPRLGGARRPGPRTAHACMEAPREKAERATVPSNYWSSSTYANNPQNAWNVNFNDGNTNANNKNNNNYVRAVRGGS